MSNERIAAYVWCGECGRGADWLAWVQKANDGEYWLYRRPPGYQLWPKKEHAAFRRNTFIANLSKILESDAVRQSVGDLPVTCRVHGERPLDIDALGAAVKRRRSTTRPASFIA